MGSTRAQTQHKLLNPGGIAVGGGMNGVGCGTIGTGAGNVGTGTGKVGNVGKLPPPEPHSQIHAFASGGSVIAQKQHAL